MKVKRGLLATAGRKKAPRAIYQALAVDEFGELAGRKRDALAQARKLNHSMAPWHRRPNDPSGRWNSYCTTCNQVVTVCTETPEYLTDIYGGATTTTCGAYVS